MGNIGSGSGSSYPTSLDYQSSLEVDSPSAGKTKARAAVPNDIISAVLAMETELGTDPAGSLTDVKTYLQTEHNTNGTHKTLTVNTTGNANTSTTATNLSMNGEASSTSSTATTTLDLGTVTNGDRIFVSAQILFSVSSGSSNNFAILNKYSGTATIIFNHSQSKLENFTTPDSYAGSFTGSVVIPVSGIIRVTGSGTLIIKYALNGTSGVTIDTNEIYAFFLKKS